MLQDDFSEAAVNNEASSKVLLDETASKTIAICKTESSAFTVANQHPEASHASQWDDDHKATLQVSLDTVNPHEKESNLETSFDETLNEGSSSVDDASPEKLYSRFLHANDLFKIITTFTDLKTRLQLTNRRGFALYREIKSKLGSMWNAVELFDMLDRRARQREFKQQTAALDRRVLVVGAGPIGLRTAIDCAFLGCDVVVVEKRRAFTRNNVLHLWPFTIKDLRELGAKKFFGKFCAGAIDHVSKWNLHTCMHVCIGSLVYIELAGL